MYTYRTGSPQNALGMVAAGSDSSSPSYYTVMYFTTIYHILRDNGMVLDPNRPEAERGILIKTYERDRLSAHTLLGAGAVVGEGAF